MITPQEAVDQARELVMQYCAAAGPKNEQDYLKLLLILATVVANTMGGYLGSPHDGIKQINAALDAIADEMRRRGPETRAAANAKRLH